MMLASSMPDYRGHAARQPPEAALHAGEVDAGAFGALLLTLYQCAREHAVDRFQDLAVQAIARHISFDCSWWADAARLDGHHLVYGSHLTGVPADLTCLVNKTQGEDAVRWQITNEPNATLMFDARQLHATPGASAIATYAGIQQMISTSSFSPVTNLLSFFSIARRRAQPAFSEGDRLLMGLLMPHLTAMLQISRVAQLSHLRAYDSALRSCLGTADGRGILRATEPGFADFLRDEWPAWSGPFLPQPLLQAIERHESTLRGKRLNADLSWVRDEVLVTLTRRTALDGLTSQERIVSQAFATGRSYKEVARDMQISPATVRHYLRSVYSKIGVSDKAALAQALARTEP